MWAIPKMKAVPGKKVDIGVLGVLLSSCAFCSFLDSAFQVPGEIPQHSAVVASRQTFPREFTASGKKAPLPEMSALNSSISPVTSH